MGSKMTRFELAGAHELNPSEISENRVQLCKPSHSTLHSLNPTGWPNGHPQYDWHCHSGCPAILAQVGTMLFIK